MYEEFLESKLSDMLIGETDFLSDFVTPEVEMDGPGEDRNYGSNQKAEKARAQCETQLTRLWIKPELEFCGKLGEHETFSFYFTPISPLIQPLSPHFHFLRQKNQPNLLFSA